MAGVRNAGRGRYTSAGYAYGAYPDAMEQENDLFIAADQAGLARELIRDNNRVGYSAQELDEDGLPLSFFIEEAQRDEQRAAAKKERARRAEKKPAQKLTFTQWLRRAVRRERRAVALCCALTLVNLTLLAFWGQAMIDGVRKRDQILAFENGAAAYQAEIDAAKIKIADAQNGARIRNKAQNELGMLREERVATQTIYIQTYSLAAESAAVEMAEENRGLLDWLLSVADILDFRS